MSVGAVSGGEQMYPLISNCIDTDSNGLTLDILLNSNSAGDLTLACSG